MKPRCTTNVTALLLLASPGTASVAFAVDSAAPQVMSRVDAPTCRGIPATIVGTGRRDIILGTDGPDVVVAFDGDDSINVLGGDDLVCAGPGSDGVEARDGSDTVVGGDGRDSISIDSEFGGADDLAVGGLGGDFVFLQGGRAYGGPGDDLIFQRGEGEGRGALVAYGGEGDDLVAAGTSYGNQGSDTLRSRGLSSVVLRGQAGPDRVEVGGDGQYDIHAGGGNDTLQVQGGVTSSTQALEGGDGRDTVDFSRNGPTVASLADGTWNGGSGLVGWEDLTGSGEDDSLTGDDGPNLIIAGPGQDVADGRGGQDNCVGAEVEVACER